MTELECADTEDSGLCGQCGVRKLAKTGLGIIITDHNVRETLSVVDRAYMVSDGHLLKEGTPDALVADPDVRARYLGETFRM